MYYQSRSSGFGPGSPTAGRRSWGARAAQAQLTPSAQPEAAGREEVGIPDEPQTPSLGQRALSL